MRTNLNAACIMLSALLVLCLAAFAGCDKPYSESADDSSEESVIPSDNGQEQNPPTEFLISLEVDGGFSDAGFRLKVNASQEPDYYLYYCGFKGYETVEEIGARMMNSPEDFSSTAAPHEDDDFTEGCYNMGGAPQYFEYFTDYLFVTIGVKETDGNLVFSNPAGFTFMYEKHIDGVIYAKGSDGSVNPEWKTMTPEIIFDETSFVASDNGFFGEYKFSLSCSAEVTAYVCCCGADIEEWNGHIFRQIHDIMQASGKDVMKTKITDEGLWQSEGFPAGCECLYFADGSADFCGSFILHRNDYVPEEDPDYLDCVAKIEELKKRYSPETDALYYNYYNVTPTTYINDGAPVSVRCTEALGDFLAIKRDAVYVLLQNSSGNFYEPYSFLVPPCFQ